MFAKQTFCDVAVAVAFHMTVDRAQGQGEPLSPLRRQQRTHGSRWTLGERRPQSMRCPRTKIEVGIKIQFDRYR